MTENETHDDHEVSRLFQKICMYLKLLIIIFKIKQRIFFLAILWAGWQTFMCRQRRQSARGNSQAGHTVFESTEARNHLLSESLIDSSLKCPYQMGSITQMNFIICVFPSSSSIEPKTAWIKSKKISHKKNEHLKK